MSSILRTKYCTKCRFSTRNQIGAYEDYQVHKIDPRTSLSFFDFIIFSGA